MFQTDYRESHLTSTAAWEYETLYGGGTYDSWIWDLEKRTLARVVRTQLIWSRTHIRLLDFACGTGRVLAYLEPMASEATGVDVSAAMLALAEKRVNRAKLFCGDITKEDFLPHRYDVVTAFRFFLNADDRLRGEALMALGQVLADDGILITNIHRNLWSMALPGYVFRRYLLRQRVKVMSFWRMKRLLVRHGFSVTEVTGQGWCTYQIYRLLGRQSCHKIERVLSRLSLLRYFSVDLILVCRRLTRDR